MQVHLVDGTYELFRQFYGRNSGHTNSDGTEVGAVRGALRSTFALLKDGATVDSLAPGEEGEVVLESTPFYAESGGQVGDSGELVAGSARFTVSDTRKRGAAFSHIGTLAGAKVSPDGRVVSAHSRCRR